MSVQGDLLREAILLIEGNRNDDYGAPHEDFERTAGMLNSLGYRGPGGRELVGSDWAVILISGKLSRLTHSPDHKDSIEDIAGYAGCYWEAREYLRKQAETAESDTAFASVVKGCRDRMPNTAPPVFVGRKTICSACQQSWPCQNGCEYGQMVHA
jgi:hypothetical protein